MHPNNSAQCSLHLQKIVTMQHAHSSLLMKRALLKTLVGLTMMHESAQCEVVSSLPCSLSLGIQI